LRSKTTKVPSRIIAGPCLHDNMLLSAEIAKHCQDVCWKYGFEYIFKASFDKANRSHDESKRGAFTEAKYSMINFKIDSKVLREDFDYKVLTDVHTTQQVTSLERSVDVMQIPAFLSRQTDLIKAVSRVEGLKAINVKKGQFMAPWDVAGILSKIEKRADREIWITERGVTFGYNRLVVDFTGVKYMLDTYSDATIVFDATHSVQLPGGEGKSSGGNREYVTSLLNAAAAVGVSNFFIETHPEPEKSPSDGANMLPLDEFEGAIRDVRKIIDARG
jgi:2-dehydro-3-deoxyphosphooctonate aldolase (KDO 8-P synthase)